MSLLGKVTRIVKWDDGDGKASIGHRRDLANQQILVAFGLPESSGYWYEIKIGKKIQVDESSSFPVVAFLGEEWNSRVVVEAQSRDWILTQWSDQPSDESWSHLRWRR